MNSLFVSLVGLAVAQAFRSSGHHSLVHQENKLEGAKCIEFPKSDCENHCQLETWRGDLFWHKQFKNQYQCVWNGNNCVSSKGLKNEKTCHQCASLNEPPMTCTKCDDQRTECLEWKCPKTMVRSDSKMRCACEDGFKFVVQTGQCEPDDFQRELPVTDLRPYTRKYFYKQAFPYLLHRDEEGNVEEREMWEQCDWISYKTCATCQEFWRHIRDVFVSTSPEDKSFLNNVTLDIRNSQQFGMVDPERIFHMMHAGNLFEYLARSSEKATAPRSGKDDIVYEVFKTSSFVHRSFLFEILLDILTQKLLNTDQMKAIDEVRRVFQDLKKCEDLYQTAKNLRYELEKKQTQEGVTHWARKVDEEVGKFETNFNEALQSVRSVGASEIPSRLDGLRTPMSNCLAQIRVKVRELLEGDGRNQIDHEVPQAAVNGLIKLIEELNQIRDIMTEKSKKVVLQQCDQWKCCSEETKERPSWHATQLAGHPSDFVVHWADTLELAQSMVPDLKNQGVIPKEALPDDHQRAIIVDI